MLRSSGFRFFFFFFFSNLSLGLVRLTHCNPKRKFWQNAGLVTLQMFAHWSTHAVAVSNSTPTPPMLLPLLFCPVASLKNWPSFSFGSLEIILDSATAESGPSLISARAEEDILERKTKEKERDRIRNNTQTQKKYSQIASSLSWILGSYFFAVGRSPIALCMQWRLAAREDAPSTCVSQSLSDRYTDNFLAINTLALNIQNEAPLSRMAAFTIQ